MIIQEKNIEKFASFFKEKKDCFDLLLLLDELLELSDDKFCIAGGIFLNVIENGLNKALLTSDLDFFSTVDDKYFVSSLDLFLDKLRYKYTKVTPVYRSVYAFTFLLDISENKAITIQIVRSSDFCKRKRTSQEKVISSFDLVNSQISYSRKKGFVYNTEAIKKHNEGILCYNNKFFGKDENFYSFIASAKRLYKYSSRFLYDKVENISILQNMFARKIEKGYFASFTNNNPFDENLLSEDRILSLRLAKLIFSKKDLEVFASYFILSRYVRDELKQRAVKNWQLFCDITIEEFKEIKFDYEKESNLHFLEEFDEIKCVIGIDSCFFEYNSISVPEDYMNFFSAKNMKFI